MDEQQLREEFVHIGRRLYEKDLIAATEGNFSARLDEERLLATPSGLCKGDLRESDLVIIDRMGNHLAGERRVSSEILLHLEVYRQRPDARAVLHAHPPTCIALMLAGRGLDQPILAENVILMGRVPIAPYARPSTAQVGESIRPFVRQTDFLLLDRHGSLTIGASLTEAFHKLEMMEATARVYHSALQMGDVKRMPEEEIAELNRLRTSRYGIRWPVIPF